MREEKFLYAEKETIRFKFVKKGEFKYLSHLDLLRIISRASVRAGLKPVYSMGFNPKPEISFSNPTPLGVESLAEYCDIELYGLVGEEKFINSMNEVLPEQLSIIQAKIIGRNVPKLMSEISLILYQFNIRLADIEIKSFLKMKKELPLDNKNLSKRNYNLLEISKIQETLKKNFRHWIKKNHDFYNSIHNFDFFISNNDVNDLKIALKIYGYAKIFKEKNNLIFKFNNFLNFLNDFINEYKLNLESFQKVEMYLNLGDEKGKQDNNLSDESENKLFTPLDAL